MCQSRHGQKCENIPVRTATHVNNAAMTVAASVLTKNPADARNPQKSV
jgi:hypothetical protein